MCMIISVLQLGKIRSDYGRQYNMRGTIRDYKSESHYKKALPTLLKMAPENRSGEE